MQSAFISPTGSRFWKKKLFAREKGIRIQQARQFTLGRRCWYFFLNSFCFLSTVPFWSGPRGGGSIPLESEEGKWIWAGKDSLFVIRHHQTKPLRNEWKERGRREGGKPTTISSYLLSTEESTHEQETIVLKQGLSQRTDDVNREPKEKKPTRRQLFGQISKWHEAKMCKVCKG